MTTAAAHKSTLALPVVLLVASLAMPPELSVMAGPLRLSPFRLLLMVLLIPMLIKALSSPKGVATDLFLIGHGAWACVSLAMTMGVGTAIETGGVYVVETVGAYLVGRLYIKSFEDAVALAHLLLKTVTILFCIAVVESLSGSHFIREIASAVLGGPGPHHIDPRLGLSRAFTSFEHPILFGVFCASAFANCYYLIDQAELRFETIKHLGIIGGGTFLSLSGGPYTALIFQIVLMAWDRITYGFNGRWKLFIGLGLAAWTALSLLSNRSPVLVFVSYLTFSAQSAYNRVHIFHYGTAEVGRHPLFGIGLNDWVRAPWMSDSMDNYWLLTTVRYGLPALILLLATICMIARGLMAQAARHPRLKHAAKAWLTTFAGYLIAGLTVHFWNALMVQFFFFLGCGAAIARVALPSGANQPVQKHPQMAPSLQPAGAFRAAFQTKPQKKGANYALGPR